MLGSQGDAGQFRTPHHIIDFIVDVVNPQKEERILDVACGTAGFLISAYKHIVKHNSSNYNPDEKVGAFEKSGVPLQEVTLNSTRYKGDLLTPDDRNRLAENIHGYDISPDMVRLSLVNMYLHSISNPKIDEYDTLTSDDRWNEYFDVILANPPFMSPKGGIRLHTRFSVTSKRSEVLFVDYIAEHLTPQGRAGVIVPEGIIFQSQNAYKQLREMLVKDYLVAVVSLPAGEFNPYSGVKTSILLLDKQLNKKTKNILFVKINNDGFGLGAQRRPIQNNDLPEAARLLKAYVRTLRTGADFCVEDFAAFSPLVVEKERLAEGGEFNLSGERYRISSIVTHSNYNMVPIGELCDLINGRAFKPVDWSKKEDGGIPIVRIQNLNDKNAPFNYYTGEVRERFIINHKELLFSWSGSRGTSFGAHIWNGQRAVLNQHIFRVGFDEKRAIKNYLYYALNQAVSQVEENLHGGVGLVHITKGNLEKIEIPLPPLDIQREIVAEIEGFQNEIEDFKKKIEEKEKQIRQKIAGVWGEE